MVAANPSTIWAQLSAPYSGIGAVPFVNTDGLTINTDVLNFYYNQATHQLSVETNGDQTGTDAINTYYQQDSYLPNATIVALTTSVGVQPQLSGSTPGHTASSSQGTGLVPLPSLSGDFIGQFSAWGCVLSGAVNTYTPFGSVYTTAVGAVANNMGGEIHIATKADGGTLTDRLIIDQNGNIGFGSPTYPWDPVNYRAIDLDFAMSIGSSLVNFNAGIGSNYYNATGNVNTAKVAGGASQVFMSSGSITLQTAPVVAAGAALTFAAGFQVDIAQNSITRAGTADRGKSIQIPVTGFAITIANNIKTLILNPAGILATGIVTMPTTPVDGQEIIINSTQTITALTVSPNAGQNIKNAPTTLVPSLTGSYGYMWVYDTATATWYRKY